ncbi:MAG: type IX secretion system sortase PorU, partial [Balneolaceae bacterium]
VVINQNLRGINNYPDYVIITSDDFLEYAQDLATYRANNDGLTPVVVTQEQVFNEFSGGLIDPVALRDYTKFLYDRALNSGQEPPKHLLFFGDATFDYKGIIQDSFTNYVVTYQSAESLHRVNSYATDDFFGFLDDNEGNMGSGRTGSDLLDIGLGRISAQTRSEAAIAVQKIKRYEDPSNTGNWQNLFTFAADDDFPDIERNRDLHVLNADGTAERMNIIDPGLRIKKIYEFDYPVEITGSGRQIPGATDAFINSINNGTLVINYSGHGNERTLSDEGLFRVSYIPKLINRDKLAVLVTATCQFGRYDDIDVQSGAEQLFFTENGGVVAAFTTTRVVYTGGSINVGSNFGLNVALSQRMVERNINGSPLRFGDIYKRTKNTYISGSPVVSTMNSKKFILIGDPATKFRLPERKAEITSVNNYTNTGNDTTLTIRALDRVTLTGQVKDLANNSLPDYNGEAVITVMDASRNVSLPTDRQWVREERCNLVNCNYEVENDVLFRGKASVQNGQFSSIFIVPKDISFSDQNGRIILFANSEGQTAGGSFTKINFNGVNEQAQDDGNGPKLDVFLNDERFVNGNLVNGSPKLIIELEDQSGINTTGTGVGHEIIATIDTKPKQSFVLNDFYEGNLNDFTRGRIEYPLDQLPEGSYTLKVRAWDVHNNPSEEEIFFEVASSEELSVRKVYNFPNPMNNATRFTFEHNQPGNPLDVSIRIYTLSGKPVQQIQQSLITTSSYASISWDGRDRDYDRLGNGTYIYVLRVATDTPKGRQATEQIEKLVIIR